MSLSYLIHELDKIEGSEDLIIRLNKGEDSAYSEALLATYFSKMGFEIHLALRARARTKMIGRLIVSPPYPNLVRLVYEKMPVLFLSGAKFDTSENGVNVNFTIHIPFEDERVISMINQKRKQLSQDSMNMVALDTTHIPISPNARKHYRWITRLKEALKTKLSRRIGAVLLFSRLAYRDKTSLRSSLFIHPNPYKRLPLSFLDKCDLNSYELPNI